MFENHANVWRKHVRRIDDLSNIDLVSPGAISTPVGPIAFDHRVDDIDAIYDQSSAWEYELVQMQAGRLGFCIASRTLGGVTISVEMQERSLRSRHIKRHPGFTVGAILSGDSGHSWKGQPIARGDFLNFGDREHDYVLPGGSVRLGIDVEADLARRTGLFALPAGIWKSEPAAFDRFVGLCLRAMSAPGGGGSDAVFARPADTELADSIIAAFLACLQMPASIAPHPRYDTLQRAEAYLNEIGWDKAVVVDEFSEALGISSRTLHRAYDSILGMGPASYIRLVRLHNFHRILKSTTGQTSVTAAALDAGFDHFGRAARYYRQQFGELPKETLMRAS